MDEILKALHTLKNECLKYENCDECPLCFEHANGDCRLSDPDRPPADWKLVPLKKCLFVED